MVCRKRNIADYLTHNRNIEFREMIKLCTEVNYGSRQMPCGRFPLECLRLRFLRRFRQHFKPRSIDFGSANKKACQD
jgi:hypothetical protein